jgi:hypothetical protein
MIEKIEDLSSDVIDRLFGTQIAEDNISSKLHDFRDAIEEAEQKYKELQATLSEQRANESELNYWLSVARAVGDTAREQELLAELEKNRVSQLIAFPMMFLSGVFIPRYIMPEFLQNATGWLPLTHINDVVRFVATENASLIDILPQLGVISLWGVAAYFVAIKFFTWE